MTRKRTLAVVLGMLVTVLLGAADCNGGDGDGGTYGDDAKPATSQSPAPSIPG